MPSYRSSSCSRPVLSLTTRSVRHALMLLSMPLAVVASPVFAQSTSNGVSTDGQAVTASDSSTATQGALAPVAVSASRDVGSQVPTFGGGTVAKRTSVGVFGDQKLVNLPFNVVSYTEKAVKNSQKKTVADFLQATDPNVRAAYTVGTLNQQLVIRGFELYSDDIALNGLYGITPRTMVATPAVDHIDVFKGASAFIYGAPTGGSGVGGMVNVALKRADDTPLTEVTTGVSGSGELNTHLDVGRRFGDNDQFGIRFNQSNDSGRTAIDGQKEYNNTTAVALDWRGSKVRLTADFLYQRAKTNQGRSSVTVGSGTTFLPSAPAATSNPSQQSWVSSDFEDTVGMVGAEYDFAPGWTAYVKGGMRHGNERSAIASPTFTNGAVAVTPFETLYRTDASAAETGVHGKFNTWTVSHQFNASASISSMHTRTGYVFGSATPSSLSNVAPVAYTLGSGFAYGSMSNPGKNAEVVNKGLSISDTLGFFNDRVLLTVGARRQELRQDGYAYSGDGSRTSTYSQGITTPIFGIVFKPLENWSIYANRTEALVAGGMASSTASNAGTVFAPYRSRQIELGTKYDYGRFGVNAALFQIEQPSSYYDAASNLSVQGGKQRNRGVEVAFYGEPVRGWRVNAGASYTQATLVTAVTASGNASQSDNGNTAMGVPRWIANVSSEYDIRQVPGLTVTGAWIYSSGQYANLDNTLKISSWSRFDLGARYTTQVFRKDVTIRATVENVGNRAYWSSSYNGYLTLGNPRTFWLSLTTDF